MDISDISDLPSDGASESTYESEIDALSKMLTDEKDDIPKLDDNDKVFKLDDNDISFADTLQAHSAKSNKCELIPDDNLAISDILEGSTELDNFISTSNVDSDLQEALGETFKTIEDSSSKDNQLNDETVDQKNAAISPEAQPSQVDSATLAEPSENAQKSESTCNSQPDESLVRDESEISKQPNTDNNEVDPLSTEHPSEFTSQEDSQNIIDEKLGATRQSTLDSTAMESGENKCADQTDFSKALYIPSLTDTADVIAKERENLEEKSSTEIEMLPDSNIPATEDSNCAKEDSVQQTRDAEREEKLCDSEEIKTLNQVELSEISETDPLEDVKDSLISTENTDDPLTHEPKAIDEIPTTELLGKEENIEHEDLKNSENTDSLMENNMGSECSQLISGNGVSQDHEIPPSDSKTASPERLENDSLVGPNCNVEDKNDTENVDREKDLGENVGDQALTDDNPNLDEVVQNLSEESSNINAETEIAVIPEEINSQSSPNVLEKQPDATENKDQANMEEQENSNTLIAQELSEDIDTLNDPLSDSSRNPTLSESKQISEETKNSDVAQENIGVISEQSSDSPGLASNISSEVESSLKEAASQDISNFDNSEVLNPPDQKIQSLDDKSQDPLSIPDATAEQIENEKSSPAGKSEDISFEESSQSPTPMQNDKFINDLYNSCMPDDTSQHSNAMENVKVGIDSDALKSVSKSKNEQVVETDALQIENLKANSNASVETENQQLMETDAPEMEILKETTDSDNSKAPAEMDDQLMETSEMETVQEDTADSEKEKSEPETENPALPQADVSESSAELTFETTHADQANDEQPSGISELESAVKFLQESEQSTESTQVESVNEGNSSIFVSVEESECDNASELSPGLPEVTLDPIAISEAEIIAEAAKLESDKREKLELEKLKNASQNPDDSQDAAETKQSSPSAAENSSFDVKPTRTSSDTPATSAEDTLQIPVSVDTKLTSEFLPKTGVIDERYREPPQIEIPESSKLVELPKSTLMIQKQRLDSPDRQISSGEPKISDTPTKKDSIDKQQPECENVGSPRIILKIAKSAIAECSEPRSPKSPKIRSSDSPNREDSPSSHKLGKIKLKLSKGGHPSIIPSGDSQQEDTWHTDCATSSISPTGMKIKITKSAESSEETQKSEEAKEKSVHKIDDPKKSETTIGMKIKLSKSGDASIVPQDNKETAQETATGKKQDSPSLGMKIKLSKSGDASIIQQEKPEHVEDDGTKRTESPIGMKIKLSKSGDASVISNEPVESTKEPIEEPMKRTDSPIGVKIKLAKNKGGSASIISTESMEENAENSAAKAGLGMKIKLSKSGDASVVHTSKDEIHDSAEQHIGMKIKLSKTGDPSIVPSGFSREYEDIAHKSKHSKHKDHGAASQRSKDDSHLEMKIKLSKTGHPTIVTPAESMLSSLQSASMPLTKSQSDRADIVSFKQSHSDITIEPVKSQSMESAMIDLHSKRKEITIAPVEPKKPKVDATTKQMLPDITIQPVSSKKEHQQSQKLVIESNAGSISRQQMSVINQEISITQVRSVTPGDSLMGGHLKNTLNVPTEGSTPSSSDCEIVESQPELIIVNENSSSSQDVMIIDEVPPVKIPKKRGRPRRNALPVASTFQNLDPTRDPLSLDQPGVRSQISPQMLQQVPPQHIIPPTADGTERPRRTCRSQKSYAPPKRGRGRGRGKRKNEALEIPAKKPRMEQEFVGIEHAAKPVISLEKLPLDASKNSPELFRALNQPNLNQIAQQSRSVDVFQMSEPAKALPECEIIKVPDKSTLMHTVQQGGMEVIKIQPHGQVPSMHLSSDVQMAQAAPFDSMNRHSGEEIDKSAIMIKVTGDDQGKPTELVGERIENGKESNQNWLAPSIKKLSGDAPSRSETISSLTVIDEETRMSAESSSRSQTPARTMSAPGAVDTLVNEESQNSVLSTATTESEKVKQPKNRRMEISLDPDEGPYTVERIAEYEWPAADKINDTKPAAIRGETFMIQEQISQYLGVKSFKRKYPDLKRRMVDMEERNFLRENGLVSESMCDMGLTAVSSSEVLDIMCNDFPEQYEEYRKYMREKAAKEHSKKQKELSAAASAERNRIDLAEMAMQSAISWNSGFNKARQESRRCSLDLQTFTVHMPRRLPKYDPARRGSNYPCALITGQYTDYYREYKPAELRYYPLNTVVYGPTRPNERKFDSQSEGSQSDSDSDSSSDDSSSTSSEGTQDTEGSQSTMDEVDMELALDPSIKCKMCSNHLNKNNRPETLIVCGTCNGNVHPSCIDLTLDMVPHIRAYAWQCTDCKTCAQCHDPADEDKMLFCDMCDRGYHIYCVGLRRVPQGRWHCQECAVCANCGSKEPGGANSDRNSVAQWQHEFKKGDKNTRVYVSTFCVPCSKLWRKGRYCPHCSRCHNATRLDQEPNLVHCGACDKYLHLECVETKGMTIDRRNYLCEFCSPNRQHLVKPLTSKTFKT